MFSVLLLLLLIIAWCLIIAGLLIFAYKAWRGLFYGSDEGDLMDRTFSIGAMLIAGFIFAGGLALWNGELKFTDIPDGCYRIGHTTGSGVGTGVNANGQVTTTVIGTSERTYTPMPC